MTAVADVSGAGAATSGLAPPTSLPGQQLTQADFLTLMTQQFLAQDPTQPLDTSQMVGQMAQFSQIAATQQMQASFSQLATSLQGDQVLNASNLIGRQVLVPSSQVSVTGTGAIAGAVSLTGATSDLQVSITDGTGKTVRTLDLGAQPAGLDAFQWDGLDDSGQAVPPGTYTLTAGSPSAPLTTYVGGQVLGIGNQSGSATAQVAGVGSVPLSQIAQIL